MPYADYEKQKQNSRENYYKNINKKRKQASEYYYNNIEKRKKQKSEWEANNKEKLREYRREWARRYDKSKKLAHWALHRAIKKGLLIRPLECSLCNKKGLIHAHHDDYKKPLDVVWLCHQCHFIKHRRKNNGNTN